MGIQDMFWFTQFINTLRPRQNGCHFPGDIFIWIFLNENVWISIKISLKFVPRGPISNIPALVQIMAWCRPGDKPLSETMMVSLPTHICVARPQWVKGQWEQKEYDFEWFGAAPNIWWQVIISTVKHHYLYLDIWVLELAKTHFDCID